MVCASACRRVLRALARPAAAVLAASLLVGLAGPARAQPPAEWVTRTYNSPDNKEPEATIRVDVATTGSYRHPNGWGGVITGVYYRSSGSGSWGTNMIDDWDAGRVLQVSLYEGPPSAYFKSAGGADEWPWNVTQGCDAYTPSPAWKTGAGLSPVPWYRIRTYPKDWAGTDHECVQLDQTVCVWPSYVEVRYSLSARPSGPPSFRRYPVRYPVYRRWRRPLSCRRHPVMFHESPVVYARHGYGRPDDPDALEDEILYDGTAPWTGGAVTDVPMPDQGWRQVYPSEHWIGLFREGGGYGLTLAYPQRTRHQPYCHHWSFNQKEVWEGGVQTDDWEEEMRARAFFDVNPGSGEIISWTVYVIPGTVDDGRREAYNLIPHRRWEFDLGTAEEGWHAGNDLVDFGVSDGILSARSTGGNPYIHSLDQLDFASDSIHGIEIRMSIPRWCGTRAQVFYITEEDPVWSDAKSKRFTITADDAYHTYRVALDDIPGWSGKTIRQFRFHPTNATTGTKDLKIDYIRLVPRSGWEFNAAGNNEGWTPVTKPLWDPAWPGNVAGGGLVLYSDGKTLDEYTAPPSWIYPALLGPYPTYIEPPDGSGTRRVEARIRVEGTGTFNARLRYTLTDDPKLFDYHAPADPYDPFPDYSLITRFDLGGHTPIWWTNLAANQWHVLTAVLPSSGTIDQLELVPTDEAGTVYIDYIRVNYM